MVCSHMVNAAEHLGLVRYIANKYPNMDFDDAVSAGSLGLVKAADTFDESKGIKFATYAARCINNEILMEFRKNKKHRGVLSIDFAINNEGEEYNAAEFTEELGYYDDDRLEREAELIDLRTAVSKLNERERQIIELRYYGEKSQKQAADLLGISQSYISRLERRILQKLKGKLNEIYQH